MSATAGMAIAALITAISAAGFGLAGLWRSARAEDAKNSADLSRVGLEAVKVGQATLERSLDDALKEIHELRGDLRHCKAEHRAAAARAEEAVARSEDLALELAELKRSLS